MRFRKADKSSLTEINDDEKSAYSAGFLCNAKPIGWLRAHLTVTNLANLLWIPRFASVARECDWFGPRH
jgi:hypothetical protein